MSSRSRPGLRERGVVVAWWLALGMAVVVLRAAGGALPAPPLQAPAGWSQWMAGRDPVVVAFGVVRLLALVGAWYGLVVTVAGVGLRLVRAHALAGLVDRLTVMPLRRLVATTLTLGISVGPLGVAAGAVTPAGRPTTIPVPTTVVVGPDAAIAGHPSATVPSATVPSATVPSATVPSATVTMHRLGPADAVPTTSPGPPAPVVAPPRDSPSLPGGVPTATGAERASTWTVRPGQCFWSIAEAELHRAWGRSPTAAEVVPYWDRLIEANRARLADPHNADLVFPGQVFTLPPP